MERGQNAGPSPWGDGGLASTRQDRALDLGCSLSLNGQLLQQSSFVISTVFAACTASATARPSSVQTAQRSMNAGSIALDGTEQLTKLLDRAGFEKELGRRLA